MKKTILFLSILFSIIACEKDYNTQNEVMSVLPKRIIFDSGDGVDYTEIMISYDGKKIKETTDHKGRKTIYTYTGELITNVTRYNGTFIEMTNDFVYENDKLKSSLKVIYSTNKIDAYITKNGYTYNSNGTILEETYIVDSKTKVETKNKGNIIYTIENGNLMKTVSTRVVSYYNGSNQVSTTYEYTFVFEYDNKSNPTGTIIGLNNIDFYSNTKNNLIKATSTYKTNGVASSAAPTVTNYTLNFNSNNHLSESKYNYTKTDNYILTYSIKYFYE